MKPRGYWNKERCHEIALTCKTRTEFRDKDLGAYMFSQKHGWLNEMCSHMDIVGNLRRRLVYVYEFADRSAYVGLTCNEKRRNNQHHNDIGPVFNHIKKTNIEPIKKIISDGYVDIKIATNLEYETVKKYESDGWLILNSKSTGGLGGNVLYWNKERCHEMSLKCTSRKEYSIKFSSAYISSRKNGWLNEVCSHMVMSMKTRNYWNYDTCKEVGITFTKRFEFSRKYSAAYEISRKNKWLDEFIPLKKF